MESNKEQDFLFHEARATYLRLYVRLVAVLCVLLVFSACMIVGLLVRKCDLTILLCAILSDIFVFVSIIGVAILAFLNGILGVLLEQAAISVVKKP